MHPEQLFLDLLREKGAGKYYPISTQEGLFDRLAVFNGEVPNLRIDLSDIESEVLRQIEGKCLENGLIDKILSILDADLCIL